jgi:predicted adenylyl cyclase CyaB
MARNVEIKARVTSLDPIRLKAQSLSTSPSENLHQTDRFFAVPRGRLKVREFADGSGEVIFYERADHSAPKESVYERFPCLNAKALAEVLSKALVVRGTVVKAREVFLVGPTRIHLDQVDGLGSFVELEVVLADGETVESGQHVALELLRALDIPQANLIAAAYIDLETVWHAPEAS